MSAIEKINSSGCYVVSCDIASGLCGNTGNVLGVAVKANLTIAIQEFKLGHFLNDGPDYTCELVLKDIGISVWEDEFIKRFCSSDANKFFAKRITSSSESLLLPRVALVKINCVCLVAFFNTVKIRIISLITKYFRCFFIIFFFRFLLYATLSYRHKISILRL